MINKLYYFLPGVSLDTFSFQGLEAIKLKENEFSKLSLSLSDFFLKNLDDKDDLSLEVFLEIERQKKDKLQRVKSDYERLEEVYEKNRDNQTFNQYLLESYEYFELYDGRIDKFLYLKNKFAQEDLDEFLFLTTDENFLSLYSSDILKVAVFYFSFLGKLSDLDKKEENLKLSQALNLFFQDIESAIVVYDDFGDLIVYNKKFRELDLSKQDIFENIYRKKIEKKASIYKFYKDSFIVNDRTFSLFVFDHYNLEKNISFNDLGIITSSIAHELNNPIGGVLAATELLECFPESLGQDQLDIIKEIKKSSKRCSELIKTFLGFAKQDLSLETEDNLEECVERASSLLRTRFVEVGSKLILNYVSGERNKVNSAVWTMILYLIFTEVFNLNIRNNLITDNKTEDLFLEIIEKKGEISFNTKKLNDSLFSALDESMFFKHLIGQVDCSLSNNKFSLSLDMKERKA